MPANEETLRESSDRALELGVSCESCLLKTQEKRCFDNSLHEEHNGREKDEKSTNYTGRKTTEQDQENYRSLPVRELHEDFFRQFLEILINDAVFEGTSRKNRVLDWREPSELRSVIDFRLSDTGLPHEDLLALAQLVIKHSVKTGHPRFINQLFSSIDPYGLLGQWLTDALNPSVYTYEVSPVFSLMEEEILLEMRKIVGWKEGLGDGLFCPGGSLANGYAINLARHYKFPELKETGLLGCARRLVVLTSEDAHYSIKKLACFLGIGSNNVCQIKTDSRGKMCIKDLKKEISRVMGEGAIPLMVSATAGTTVLGAFDPLIDIANICKKYNVWLHVDAAWGGGALLSKKYRHLLQGIELADSVTWNPHKLLAAPQQCSTLLIRHEGILQSAHGSKASYLFQPDKCYDTLYDTGDKHIQCGRRADVLKFWFMWKAKGSRGLEMHVDRVFELSKYFTDYIKQREGFELLMEPECTNVCFWYISPSKRHLNGVERREALHKIAPIVKERMMKSGSMLITYQPLRGLPNFFRLVLQNSGVTEADMRFFAEEIEKLARDL